MAQRKFRSDDTDRWLHGRGSGKDGDLNVSSNTTLSFANAGAAVALDSKNVTLDIASSFANGDLIGLHQSIDQGGDYGEYEFNRIVSGGGTTSLVLERPATKAFLNNSVAKAQIFELKQFNNITIDSGVTLKPPAWDGQKGGILPLMWRGLFDLNGILDLRELGFRGNNTATADAGNGLQGEGASKVGTSKSRSNTFNGGGGGQGAKSSTGREGGGAGASQYTAGQNGQTGSGGSQLGGLAGSAFAQDELLKIIFGGGGGQGGTDGTQLGAGSPAGSAIAFLIGRTWTIDPSTGIVYLDGADGDDAPSADGGGGGASAPGALLAKVIEASIGTNRILGRAGSGGAGGSAGGGNGGNSGLGNVVFDYLKAVTGSITGSNIGNFTKRQDFSLFRRSYVPASAI